MTGRTLASEYLSAIERGDLDAILALFRPGATVHSPLYGPLPAAEFYPRLLADTGRSELHLRGVTSDGPLVSIWFRFDWTLPSGSAKVLGTVRRETISDPNFYGQFFALVQSYVDQEKLSQASVSPDGVRVTASQPPGANQ